MRHHLLLIIHLLAATLWIGGHLLLTLRYLPKALKTKDVGIIRNFEKQYEAVGLPALLILVVTGICMAYDYGITMSLWFTFSGALEKIISIKLLLLFSTFLLAVHARLFIIPRLSAERLNLMAAHIVLITLISIAMLVMGTFVRFGGI
jgi:putative copper export protein